MAPTFPPRTFCVQLGRTYSTNFFCSQAGLTQGMLQWRPTGALHFFFQASPGMRPARRQHLRPNPAAPTWLRRGLGPGADTKIENPKQIKIYRQSARTRKYPWNRLPHSRDRPPQVQQGSGKHDPSGNPRTNAASPQKLTTNEEVHTNPDSSWQAAAM